MLTRFLMSGSFALALLLSIGSTSSVFAQRGGGGGGGSHHGGGGGGSHHGGGGGGSHHGGGGYGGGHHGGGYGGGTSHHHHHGGGGSGIYIGGNGFGIGFGSGGGGYGGYYGGYGGGYNGLRYSSGFRGYSNGGYYDSYPSYNSGVYVTPQYVTPQYVNPAPNYVYQDPAPTVVYRSPSVQPSAVIARPEDSGQRSNLPGVSFGARAHLNELAEAVAQRTNLLCVALHDSYSGSPQFKEVYRDTYLLITISQQLMQVSGDSQATLDAVAEMNAVLDNVTPAIERWQPTGGGGASAASHLSSVTSALKLLSVDAGWDGSQPNRRSAAPTPATPQAPPVAPLPEVAPAPDLQSSSAEPTPVDDLPVP